MANRIVQVLQNNKIYKDTKIKEKFERAHEGNPWVHLEMKGVTSSRHPSAEVTAERLVRMESGRCFPEVRKIIQSNPETFGEGGQNLEIQSIQNKRVKKTYKIESRVKKH